MRTLRRLLALPPDERRVLVAAVLLVVAARLSLRLCPYRVVRRLAARLACLTARLRAPAAVIALAVPAAAVLPVVASRLGLRLCSYRVVPRLAARPARPTARLRAPAAVIALAVAAAGRRVPGGRNCLAQALAAHVLLGRHGHAQPQPA